jgi:hypothetical protein
MPDILTAGIDFERSFLEELVDDLKGTFHCIAHAGKADDKMFIRDRQKYIWEKYENGLNSCLSYESVFIERAYTQLQDMLKIYNTPIEIKKMAEEALYNNLMEGIDEDEIENLREHSFF